MDKATEVLAKELIYLDCALTNKPFATAVHTWTNSAVRHPMDFIVNSALYYLSDGGYSRLFVRCTDETDPDTIELCLDSVSTPAVKLAWGQAIELRNDVENTLKVALKMALP